MKIRLTINGKARELEVAPGESATAALKKAGCGGLRNGCDGQGSCGACAVQLDGELVNTCILLAPQLAGRSVKTIDGISHFRDVSPLQSAFIDAGVVQCGYCTPSMLLAVEPLVAQPEAPTREQVMDAMSGVFCRCTGYEQFVGAVELARERTKNPAAKGNVAKVYRDDLKFVGRATGKVDGAHLARAGKAYVEDRVDADACHIKLLRSPYAHAYIKSIDTSAAEAMPGVVMVVTHKNCPDINYSQAGQGYPEPSPYDRKMFGEKVRHIGDRVAAVMAESRELAAAALEKIVVEYEVLEPVLTIAEASAAGAPRVHKGPVDFISGTPDDLDNSDADPRDGRITYLFPIHADIRRNIAASVSGGIGDLDKGFAEADVILERTYKSSQVQCTPLEPHAVYTKLVEGRLVVHAATQVPWHLRRMFARLLDLPENRIRVIKEHCGGAFGAKQDMVLEEIAAFCTWTTGRPVSHRFTREEEFVSSRTRHPIEFQVKLGAKKDGKLTAVYMGVKANTGPYGQHCLTVPMNAVSKSLPLFLCDNAGFDVVTYYSNIPPAGAYQGYGAPQGAFAMQMAMAELAEELGLGQLDIVEMNRVGEGSWLEILRCLGEGRPGKPEQVFSCGLKTGLALGREMIEWDKKETHQDPDIAIGKGLAIVQQGSGLPGLDASNATVTMFGDGTFMLLSGGTDLGTGLDTVSTKFVAETLCVPMEAVSIIAADTDATPFDVGAYASSGTYYSGGAALNAAKGLKNIILDIASEMLGEPVEHLDMLYPGIIKGKNKQVTYAEIAHETQSGVGCGQLTFTSNFTGEAPSFPYGTHFCQVAVNTRTGNVKLQKYYAFQDSGTPINPELANGQTFGGVLKTIGHSLFEEMVLDDEGRCLNPNLLEYIVPMSGDVPDDFRSILVHTDEPFGPFGAKSISEIACGGAAPAIATAIHDAVGVWIRSWPFTPEKLLRAMGKL
ncbi:MAG: molybdopterin-dependent oxidoreductase Mo/Fe-S-binding subunit [Deltaproteobacteria bacterium CG_4_9_14_3_um_filter_63_12]|nr:MAG: molybdopterin-dependent oxidoreductase Mo/Fe-S-binding subunit [Deltaproteobacteria bacterium CG_4_9_14_3_um_filter_63_12]